MVQLVFSCLEKLMDQYWKFYNQLRKFCNIFYCKKIFSVSL